MPYFHFLKPALISWGWVELVRLRVGWLQLLYFELPAVTIAKLYKLRWQIELFFKWIKQHLRIKRFYGNTENAVRVQIWIAVCSYVLVAIVKKRLAIPHSLYTILQVLSVSTLEKMPILSAFQHPSENSDSSTSDNQLVLF